MKSAWLNWTSGVASSVVKYGVCNGFDAWKILCNKCIFLAEDFQNIFIQELLLLKPVSETEIDTLFNDIEMIIDLYVKVGPVDDLSEEWIRAAVLKYIPEKIATTLALEVRKATTVEEMQSLISIDMHDHRAGLHRGRPGPMICTTWNCKQTGTST